MNWKSRVLVTPCSWGTLSQSRLQFVSSATHGEVDEIQPKLLHAVIEGDAAQA
jgi:hypothetical protein